MQFLVNYKKKFLCKNTSTSCIVLIESVLPLRVERKRYFLPRPLYDVVPVAFNNILLKESNYIVFLSNRIPEYGNSAFNMKRGKDILRKWDQIPDSVDVLLTHGPPLGNQLTFMLGKITSSPSKFRLI